MAHNVPSTFGNQDFPISIIKLGCPLSAPLKWHLVFQGHRYSFDLQARVSTTSALRAGAKSSAVKSLPAWLFTPRVPLITPPAPAREHPSLISSFVSGQPWAFGPVSHHPRLRHSRSSRQPRALLLSPFLNGYRPLSFVCFLPPAAPSRGPGSFPKVAVGVADPHILSLSHSSIAPEPPACCSFFSFPPVLPFPAWLDAIMQSLRQYCRCRSPKNLIGE